MTRNNIRFSVHNTEYSEYSEYSDDDEDDESLFMVNMVNILAPWFSIINTTRIDPTQIDPTQIDLTQINTRQNLSNIQHDKITEIHPKHTLLYVDITDKKYESCIICSDDFKNTDVVSVLKCDHIYHPKCIKEWCNHKAECPLCKVEIAVSRSRSDSRSRRTTRISHMYIAR